MGKFGQTYNRGAHHRVRTDSRPSGRAAEIAAHVQAAGADGVTQCALAAAIGCQPCNLDSLLASATPRYPAIYEDDAGRLYWLDGECEA